MCSRHLPSALFMVIAVAALATSTLAQETTGRLVGRARDTKGEPVPFASVTVTGDAMQGARSTVTDADGSFLLLALPVGDYAVRIAQVGHQTRVLERVPVRLGQTTTLEDIILEEQVILTEPVQVSARAAVVDTRSTLLGANLSARDYSALPVQRDYKTIAVLLPHANASTLG